MGSKTSRNPKCNETQVKWKKQIGRALDIAINAKGAIWAVGATKKIAGGRGIYFWHNESNKWRSLPGGAVKIAVNPDGQPVIINSQGNVFKYNQFSKGWKRLPGSLREIVISKKGQMFGIGTEKVRGSHRILKF